jgi:hypothetical protein
MPENHHYNSETIRRMKQEIHQLADEQVKAMTTAALSGMANDEAKRYERRHERMRHLLGELQSLQKRKSRRRPIGFSH